MDKFVLDTSVLVAFLLTEHGGEILRDDFLLRCVISSVNLAEVQTVLVRRGVEAAFAWERARSTVPYVEPFTADQARLAGSLIAQTRPIGLSLGDRACLALAITLDAPVYTADQAWRGLDIGCTINVIR